MRTELFQCPFMFDLKYIVKDLTSKILEYKTVGVRVTKSFNSRPSSNRTFGIVRFKFSFELPLSLIGPLKKLKLGNIYYSSSLFKSGVRELWLPC